MLASELKYSVELGLLLLGGTILLGPIVAMKLRIPALIGLIAMGTIFGPYVLHWLQPGGFVATVGAAGLLYLMFIAGVELDLKEFNKRRNQAISFGLLTFAVPFALSLAVVTVLFASLGQGIESATVLAIAALSTTGPLTQTAVSTPIGM